MSVRILLPFVLFASFLSSPSGPAQTEAAPINSPRSQKLLSCGAEDAFVLENVRLILFAIPGRDCGKLVHLAHRLASHQHLRRASSYPPEEFERLAHNASWTRAAFFRDPLERFLAAYLQLESGKQQSVRGQSLSFAAFVERVEQGWADDHWAPQCSLINCKRWAPLLDFVGHHDTLFKDVRRLLQFIGAWGSTSSSLTSSSLASQTAGGWTESALHAVLDDAPSSGLRDPRMDAITLHAALYTRDLEARVKRLLHADYAFLPRAVLERKCSWPMPLYPPPPMGTRGAATVLLAEKALAYLKSERDRVADRAVAYIQGEHLLCLRRDGRLCLSVPEIEVKVALLDSVQHFPILSEFERTNEGLAYAALGPNSIHFSLFHEVGDIWSNHTRSHDLYLRVDVKKLAHLEAHLCAIDLSRDTTESARRVQLQVEHGERRSSGQMQATPALSHPAPMLPIADRFYAHNVPFVNHELEYRFGHFWFVRVPWKGIFLEELRDWVRASHKEHTRYKETMDILRTLDTNRDLTVSVQELEAWVQRDGIILGRFREQVSSSQLCKAAKQMSFFVQFHARPFPISDPDGLRGFHPLLSFPECG